MSFLEIAFQAEVSRYEDPEFEDCARKNCDENFETRGKVIEELRQMIQERGECSPRRMDDAYLLRFLRCRRFIPALAHKLMVRYEDFRCKNAFLYNCDVFSLNVKQVYWGVQPDSPEHGRVLVLRVGNWDTEAVPLDDLLRCALIMEEIGVMQPKLQILGITVVLDLKWLSTRQVTYLTPTAASQVVALIGMSFPLMMHGAHIVNYNWTLHPAFYFFKKFMPSAGWSRLHFHKDLASLHRHIDPEYLPKDLGGHCRHLISFEEWIAKIEAYKDDFIVSELRDLGFYVRG